VVAWVLFRADSFATAGVMLGAMAGHGASTGALASRDGPFIVPSWSAPRASRSWRRRWPFPQVARPSSTSSSSRVHRPRAAGSPLSSASENARAGRWLLVGLDAAAPFVFHPDDGHAVAHVVALEVTGRGQRHRVGADLRSGLREREVQRAPREAHEEVAASDRDSTALTETALRGHVDIDVRRRWDERRRP